MCQDLRDAKLSHWFWYLILLRQKSVDIIISIDATRNCKDETKQNSFPNIHQRRIEDCYNIQDGALCDNSFIITKRSILDVAAVLDPPVYISGPCNAMAKTFCSFICRSLIAAE